MRTLFRACSERRVRYLVIGGQAAILYGASHFSQDLDLWVDPEEDNLRRFIRVMSELGARFHKLTPPLTASFVRKGHGFHFLVPLHGGKLYLDIMGRPPRVGGFSGALKRAERMLTPWGRLPVVSIPDLVELKKTNRPADYDVITRLVMIRVGREVHPAPRLLRWALDHLFRIEDVLELLLRFGARMGGALPPGMNWARKWRELLPTGGRPGASEIDAAARLLGDKAQRLQARGRRYWVPRIDELRRLRAEGGLLPEGELVTPAITSRRSKAR